MTKEELKESLVKSESNYKNIVEIMKKEGVEEYVEWETVRKLKVYLHGKGYDTSINVSYKDSYSYVSLESVVVVDGVGKNVTMIIITPEDTEGTAYGRTDKKLAILTKLLKKEVNGNE